MKRFLFLPILLIVISCTSLDTNITQAERSINLQEINMTIDSLKEATNLNKYEEIEEFFLPTFKNKIIVNNIKQYDLSKLTLIFSEITLISKTKAKGLMIVNYDTESSYFDVTWKKQDKIVDGINIGTRWIISNVAVKK